MLTTHITLQHIIVKLFSKIMKDKKINEEALVTSKPGKINNHSETKVFDFSLYNS